LSTVVLFDGFGVSGFGGVGGGVVVWGCVMIVTTI
jgi:hypothetical protein